MGSRVCGNVQNGKEGVNEGRPMALDPSAEILVDTFAIKLGIDDISLVRHLLACLLMIGPVVFLAFFGLLHCQLLSQYSKIKRKTYTVMHYFTPTTGT